MLPTDPFKNEIRQYIPLDLFWDLVADYQTGSLKHQSVPELSSIDRRIMELADAESKYGFVYEAELLWLQAIASGEFSASYADWVRVIFDEVLLQSPLRWAARELAGCYLPQSLGFDFWAGQMKPEAAKCLPFSLIPELESTGIFAFCEPAMTVYGKRHGPSPTHLIKAFELFHNLPYYVLEHKEWLTFESNETNMMLNSIAAIDPESAENWILDQNNDYNGGDDYLFVGRQAVPHAATGNRLEDLAEASQDPEWLKLKKRGVEFMPSRIADRYVALLPANNQPIQLTGDRWPDRRRKTKALLIDTTVRCRCGLERHDFMEFGWGSCVDWCEYQMGDTIKWSKHSIGLPDIKKVYVRSRLENQCPKCHADIEQVLCIQNNKITAFEPQFAKRVEFVFEAPFVDIDGQLINWGTFTSQLMLELFQQHLNESEHPEWPVLREALEQNIMTKRKMYPSEFCTAWLACRYRSLLSVEQFWQALVFANAMQFDSASEFSKESTIESTGIIQRMSGGYPSWYQFRWGSLLNFASYQLGDSIEWSDYVFGEPEVRLAFVKATKIGKYRSYCYLRIEDNRITEFIDNVAIVAKEFAECQSYDAYVDGFPYHIGPYRRNC